MADPVEYEPQFDFSDYQSTNPSRPLPGHELDVELWNISNAMGGTQTALADVRRSDGKLKNDIVTLDSMDPAVEALLRAAAGNVSSPAVGFPSRAAFVTANAAEPGLGYQDGSVVFADGLTYKRAAGSTALPDLVGWVANGLATPFHYGAAGNGAADDRPALTAMDAAGYSPLIVSADYHVLTPFAFTNSAPVFAPSRQWDDLSADNQISWSYANWRDEGFVPQDRFLGRAYFGAAAKHSGNRYGANGYGTDPVSQNIASWVIKNSLVTAMHPDQGGRIGITGAAWIKPGAVGSIGAGLVGIARNDGISGTARGLYAEVISAKTAGLTAAEVAAEFQVGNRGTTTPVVSAYDMAGSIVNGMQIGVVAQNGYTIGDADTPYAAGTVPSGAAIDLSGGDTPDDWQKWTAGIVFRNGSMVRDGSSFANAMLLAQKHKLRWEVSAFVEGASVWSEVTDGAQRMAMAFRDRNVTVYGPSGQTVAEFRHDGTGAQTVNNSIVRAARTGVSPAIVNTGSDANVGFDVIAKAQGAIRFMSHDGAGESLRVSAPAGAPTDFLTVTGSAGGGGATVGAAGASTNIDIVFTPKGTGTMRFGTHTANADAPVVGYITIKDAGGTTRKLACIA